MPNSNLICPNCKKNIELSEALLHEFQEEFELKHKKDMEEAVRLAEEKAKKNLEEKSSAELEKLQKQLSEEKEKKSEELEKFKKEFEQQREKDNEEFEKLKKAQEQAQEEIRKKELAANEEKKRLEDERKEFEENKRKEEERIKITVAKEESEKYRLDKLEYEKKINDMQKALEEAQRKGKQGSQQLQGEVLELDFEQGLRSAFPTDEIVPIAKGKVGADVRQIVKTARGSICGTILWETKRTKGWSNDWTEKLKGDLRTEKANVAILVTNSFPKGFNLSMGLHDGVWLVDYSLAQTLAELIRQRLIDVAKEKYLASHKEGRQEQLYEYINSHEFVQQIESLLEVRNTMVSQVDKERAAFEKQWKIRTEAADKLLKGTARMIGSIQGRLGTSNHLQIKGLDMLELDSGEE
ncbi:MAG: DUF2130 domain-containing protein [Bacteriovoracaceae bacterium]